MTYDYRYAKKWRLDRERGLLRYTDPAPVVAHVHQLLESGASKRAIAEASRVSATTITNLTRHQPKHITRTMARRILAVRVEHLHQRSAPRGFVPAIGARRRIQALQALGHSAATIGEAAGVTQAVVHNIINQAGDWVTAANRDAIHRAYALLWDKPGQSQKVATMARGKGWVVPMAWDDIDDPTAQPNLTGETRQGKQDRAALVEDVEFLLEHDPNLTINQAAARLNTTPNWVQSALARSGRKDLTRAMARNNPRQPLGEGVARKRRRSDALPR